MRPAPLLVALVLVACDAKEADSSPAKTAAAKAAPAKTAAADPAKTAAADPAKTDAADPAKTAAADPAKTDAEPEASPTPNDVRIDHAVKLLDGSDKSLTDYRGKALLVVNTASECGYTPQYAGLQELYGKYKDRGLEVLAFPSNDFGGQEPGTPEQIREFVDSKYSVEFEMFEKVAIKGPDKSPLYQTLTEQTAEGIRGDVQWNFTKFLVDPEGRVVQRFDSAVEPTAPELIEAIERVLPRA